METTSLNFITSKTFEINRTFDKYFRKLHPDAVLACLDTIIRMIESIIKAPTKRMFKKTSNVLKKTVLSIKGGEELLISVGFKIVVHEFEEKYKLEDSKEINESLNEILSVVYKLKEKARKWKDEGNGRNDEDKDYFENLKKLVLEESAERKKYT